MNGETLSIDSVLKCIEGLSEREEEREKKIKELMQWNEMIAKDIKDIMSGVSGIRLAEKIATRNELLEWLETETIEIQTLLENYIEKRNSILDAELKNVEEIQRKIAIMRKL